MSAEKRPRRFELFECGEWLRCEMRLAQIEREIYATALGAPSSDHPANNSACIDESRHKMRVLLATDLASREDSKKNSASK